MADFGVSNEGTIFLLKPLTDTAREWCKNHLPADAPKLGQAYAVEQGYIRDISQGIVDHGMDFEDL